MSPNRVRLIGQIELALLLIGLALIVRVVVGLHGSGR